jgi:peptide/nickel transport system permease protein
VTRFWNTLAELRHYPSALVGSAIILLLLLAGLYAVIAIPYDEAIRLWRGWEAVWNNSPKNARPVYLNWFRREKLPSTIMMNSRDEGVTKSVDVIDEGKEMTDILFAFTFEYPYNDFAQELSLFFDAEYVEMPPYISLGWLTPDGREIRVGDFAADRSGAYRASQNEKLQRRLGGVQPHVGLFAPPDSEEPTALQGTYTLEVAGLVFEEGADLNAELVIYG